MDIFSHRIDPNIGVGFCVENNVTEWGSLIIRVLPLIHANSCLRLLNVILLHTAKAAVTGVKIKKHCDCLKQNWGELTEMLTLR